MDDEEEEEPAPAPPAKKRKLSDGEGDATIAKKAKVAMTTEDANDEDLVVLDW